jgi:photosystem II stability/assembly factor-like uncharacterized protein
MSTRRFGTVLVCLVVFSSFQWRLSSGEPTLFRDTQLFNALPARSIGPVNMGGRVTSVAVVEPEAAVMYVAAATGGVWKTIDGGATWRAVFDQATSLCIGDVAVAPSNPDVVWVGTGESNILRSVSVGDGVYKSADGGKSWKYMGLKETRHVGKILVHPKNSDIVYVGALGRAFGPNPERGLFKTTDGGKTWSKVLYIDDSTGVIDLAMDPTDPDLLYACAYTFRRDAFSGTDPRKQFGMDAGLYKTTDGGKTWNRLTTGLPDRPLGRCGVGVSRSDPSVVFAVVQTDKTGPKGDSKSLDFGGVFRSDDKGQTWNRVSTLWPKFGFYFGQIRVDPSDSQRIYVLDIPVHVSHDGGRTFKNLGQAHADNHALWINPKNSDHVVLGNDGGLFFSKNQGKQWQPIRAMAVGQYYAVGVDMQRPYRVYGGLQDNGSWGTPSATFNAEGIAPVDSRMVGGGDGFYCQADPTDPDIVYCEQQYGVLQRVDLKAKGKGRGKNIRPAAPKGETAYRFNWNAPILISPHEPKTLFFGGNKLFKSPDRGDKWDVISPDMTRGGQDKDTGHTITTVAESPLKAGVLWVGTDDGRVHVSKNEGKDWIEVTAHIPVLAKESWVTRVECSHHAEGTCYVTVDRHRNDDRRPYVYKTTDYGANWQAITSNLPVENYVHVIRESSKNPNLLFAGTEFGLFGTFDGGKVWHHMKTGLPPAVLVHDLVIHPRERELVVGTHGRGIYIIDIAPLEEMTAKVLQSDVHLFDVRPALAFKVRKGEAAKDGPVVLFPNPAYGASISIYLKDSLAQPATVTILDKDGRTLATLKAPTTRGLQQVVWDLRAGEGGELVAPGEYTARLQIASQTWTKSIRVEAEEPQAANPTR